jgi:hypothetical protein
MERRAFSTIFPQVENLLYYVDLLDCWFISNVKIIILIK